MRCSSPHHLSDRSRLLFFYLIYILYTPLKFSFGKNLPFVKILKYYNGAVLYNSDVKFFSEINWKVCLSDVSDMLFVILCFRMYKTICSSVAMPNQSKFFTSY